MKIPNKRELHQIISNQSSDIVFKDLIKLFKDLAKKKISFLVNDPTLPIDNLLKFRNNL